MKREELARNHRDERREDLRRFRERETRIPAGADRHHAAPPAAKSRREIAQLPNGDTAGWRDDERGQPSFGKGDGAVREIGRRERLGGKKRQLLQLQRDLVGGWVVDAARQDEGP